jgi:hypothetical protein
MKKCFYLMLVGMLATLTNTFSFAQTPAVNATVWKPGDKIERFGDSPQRTQTAQPQTQTRQPEQVRQAPPPKRQKETWYFEGYYTMSSTGGVSRVTNNKSNFTQTVAYDPNSEYFSSDAFGGKLSKDGSFVATASGLFTKFEGGSGYLDEYRFSYTISGVDSAGMPVTFTYSGRRRR